MALNEPRASDAKRIGPAQKRVKMGKGKDVTAAVEQKAGAQYQHQKRMTRVKRAKRLKIAGPTGRSTQDRLDVMKAAGYTPQEMGSFMQKEGKRLLQEGWERQNVGRFQPP